ncbi:hypothetical protein DICSQDRAFT_129723 [Dichomitus squalens LYAD-421 SS1]|uniref:Uncharacterized protein n=1 Tax=Dichomitus squalens (strain LYAD-421) TaxID=732165 RepID=R7SLL5_DICSQ|nr:uncharacterized protein DICSQDRAFT_129723 [Dichomitus squalens LYAD-421 SS1]EJF57051.1 hypothetical protein DICSQDRAFT_129723 [Dichomitus squalens LYAD-421 SS1]
MTLEHKIGRHQQKQEGRINEELRAKAVSRASPLCHVIELLPCPHFSFAIFMTCSPSLPSDAGEKLQLQGGSPETLHQGDSATYMFTGTAIQVFVNRQDSSGNALFGIDTDGQHHGGDTCNPQQNPSGALWGTSQLSLSPTQHTLFITNSGQQLILDSIVVFGGPSTASRQTQTTVPSSASSTSTHFSMTTTVTLPLPLPTPSGKAPQSTSTATTSSSVASSLTPGTLTQSQADVTHASTLMSSVTSPIVHTSVIAPSLGAKSGGLTIVSGYTTISTIDGMATTITVQPTTIVVKETSGTSGLKETSPISGLSKGAIAGVAVGVIAFFMMLFGTWWWWRRCNRVRFLYGISHLDFDPTVASSSDVELSSQNMRARESEVTLYSDALAEYKRPSSYASFASDAEKRPLPHATPTPPGLSQEQQASMHNTPCF